MSEVTKVCSACSGFRAKWVYRGGAWWRDPCPDCGAPRPPDLLETPALLEAALKKLDAVTAQRDELREAADAFTDHIDGLDCNAYWPRLAKALEAAR